MHSCLLPLRWSEFRGTVVPGTWSDNSIFRGGFRSSQKYLPSVEDCLGAIDAAAQSARSGEADKSPAGPSDTGRLTMYRYIVIGMSFLSDSRMAVILSHITTLRGVRE